MGLSHSPKIVTDGLVLCLDAANPRSYPGTGTTWTDRSANGYDATLINGPTFDSANGGNIVFDGTDDYSLLSNDINLGTQASINIWLQLSNNAIVAGGSSYSNGGYILASSTPTYGFYVSANGSYWHTNYNVSNTTNTWKNLSVSRNASSVSFYVNGVFYSSHSSLSPTNGMRIKGIGAYDNGDYKMNGRIALMQIYDRALSADEVLQNYNATRHRFGV